VIEKNTGATAANTKKLAEDKWARRGVYVALLVAVVPFAYTLWHDNNESHSTHDLEDKVRAVIDEVRRVETDLRVVQRRVSDNHSAKRTQKVR
jgi:cell division protein FtsB